MFPTSDVFAMVIACFSTERVPVNETLIDIVIGKLRTEDIYHQQKALPLPQHKTTALAQQSAILFVVLFFSPNTLHNQTARMREIVDKYFSDNWVVNIYMGITVNLIDIWEPFKAAKMALANTLDVSNIKDIATSHGKDLNKLINETNEILTEGNLTKSYILDNVPKVLALARRCNVVLRWHLLHTSGRYSVCETVKKSKQVRDSLLVDCGSDPQKVLQLLLHTAQFENKVCDLFKTVLNEREEQWMKGKAESLVRINELIEVFSGTKNIMRVKKSESLRNWFQLIAQKIDSLNIEETSISARQIAQLIQALEEVQSFQQMTNNLGVKQLATETCDLLRNMLNAVNVRDTLLVQMQIIGDFSYGWLLVDDFTSMIQSGIKENPNLVNKLRAVFLKLSSAMETALLRINQADDGNLPSVSEHYSHQLVLYVRKVLQVIPREVFTLMSEIAHIQTTYIPELPPRLEKDKLRDYAALDARFQIAKLTYEMSVFSTGLLQMQSTLVGIIRVDPRELLEEGVRKELEMHITSALETGLTFNPKLKIGSMGSDLQTKLDELGKTMEGNKNSFEYIQDYLDINGLKMWQEELKKVIGDKVDLECRMLRSRGAALDLQTSTFMGRLCKQLIQTVDPKVTFYYEMESSWVDIKTRTKLVDLKFFKKILKAVGVPGLVGLNKIISFLIVKHLQNLVGFFIKEANNNKAWLEMFGAIAKSLTPHTLTVDQPSKVYPQSVTRLQNLLSAGMLETLTTIGNLQLLRKQISFTLNHTARVQARNYTLALSAVNDAYLLEIKKNQKDPTHPCPSAEDLGRLSQLLDWIGLNDPLNQIYVTTRSIPFISLLIFLFSTAHIPRFNYEKSYASMICKKTGEGLAPLTIGIYTLLKQFHSKVARQYITYCCQYTKSYMLSTALLSKQEIPPEALSMMNFLEDFVDYAEIPRTSITEHIPEFIVELLKRGIGAYVDA
ncbi:hypothetical protein GE061_003242 [Apolygus lucorum]|uniref:Uncharacterized protein n=1 Tax=Apolygus lucorum TaxID=248454 RepID=A0A6A4JPM5_APOLU|nr:hypothetical protein GE061_003242 [Apolygus lucorum]